MNLDYLKVRKNPIKKSDIPNKLNKEIQVEKKIILTNNNNSKIIDFIKELESEILLKNEYFIKKERNYTIGNAEKIDKIIVLTQMSEKEIQAIKTNKKYISSIYAYFENNDNGDNDNKGKSGEDEKIKKEKKIVKYDFENGINSNIMDDLHKILTKYKYYHEDDSLYKVNTYDTYILNNKIGFLKYIENKLENFLDAYEEHKDKLDISDKESGFTPLLHQELVKEYLNATTPYRGLLLYHGLGSGKTCTSIGIIEAMKSVKSKIFIMSPASLSKNYKTQMKFCGSEVFKSEGNWEYVDYPSDESREKFIQQVHVLTKLPLDYLKKRNGVYLLNKDIKKEESIDNEELEKQINLMIKHRFHFISYNGITTRTWNEKYKLNKNYNPFHNSTIIIDEGHNFVSRIINKLNIGKKSISTELYEHIINAENCNVIVLSGTPLINYPCELGVMFNLISGCNIVIELRCRHKDTKKLNLVAFRNALQELKLIDYLNYNSKTNTLQIIKNPYGFVNTEDNRIVYDFENGRMTTIEFKNVVKQILIKNGYTIIKSKEEIKNYKKFPDTQVEFNKYFVNEKTNKLTRKDYFQRKVVGLISYLGDKKELMPQIVAPNYNNNNSSLIYKNEDMFIEEINMNENVLQGYYEARLKERDMLKGKGQKGDNQTSSYSIFSRSACNFVFPKNIQRPYKKISPEKMTEDDLEVMTDMDMLEDVDGKYDTSDLAMLKKKENIEYIQQIQKVLKEFTEHPYKYFNTDIVKYVKDKIKTKLDMDEFDEEESNLMKYSPKFYKILLNIMNTDNKGLHLLYSNFRTLEGIGIFKIILDYHGYTEFKVRKDITGTNITYKLDINHPYYYNREFNNIDYEIEDEDNSDYIDKLNGRKFYALYTGMEGTEEKEIYRNIFNGNLDKIPSTLRAEIGKYFYNNDLETMMNVKNKYGELINLLIISSSGAEGIDLKNVRYVHIMEPYWHPVRINQVIGRARRIKSHQELPEDERDVKVFLYILKHNRQILREKQDALSQLIQIDTDFDKEVTSSDEKLYKIMMKKKKLMEEFLDTLKEASIDCKINYDDKSKCLSFPTKTIVNPNKSYVSKIDFTQNQYNDVKLKKKPRFTLGVLDENN
jgi:hypothetical protein